MELKERNGIVEQIKAEDIGLKYNAMDKIQTLKDSQNSFMWIHGILNQKSSKIPSMVTFDEKLLKERFGRSLLF